jgi:hypothetical protein
MMAAEIKITKVHEMLNASNHFQCNWYEEPHSFKIPAQEAAIGWLDKWLKRSDRKEQNNPQGVALGWYVMPPRGSDFVLCQANPILQNKAHQHLKHGLCRNHS